MKVSLTLDADGFNLQPNSRVSLGYGVKKIVHVGDIYLPGRGTCIHFSWSSSAFQGFMLFTILPKAPKVGDENR